MAGRPMEFWNPLPWHIFTLNKFQTNHNWLIFPSFNNLLCPDHALRVTCPLPPPHPISHLKNIYTPLINSPPHPISPSPSPPHTHTPIHKYTHMFSLVQATCADLSASVSTVEVSVSWRAKALWSSHSGGWNPQDECWQTDYRSFRWGMQVWFPIPAHLGLYLCYLGFSCAECFWPTSGL